MFGGLTLGCFVVGLKFLKFWRLARDRFFIFFAAAFWIFATGWGLRAFLHTDAEHGHFVYLPRLLSFLLILVAIIDKNRRSR
ncbi:MAG: hypothetical protein H0T89_08760 [Deltaproteobacteria bacterium]|nr:hypothetical protein [Deltaproteobacteria bacterium]